VYLRLNKQEIVNEEEVKKTVNVISYYLVTKPQKPCCNNIAIFQLQLAVNYHI